MLPMRKGLSAMPQSGRAEEQGAIYYVAVWLDHNEAQVIHFSVDVHNPRSAHPEQWSRHSHISADQSSKAAATAEPDFYFEVAKACEDAPVIFLAGLSTAKTDFVKYLHRRLPGTMDRIFAIETPPRTTDNQLVAEARRLLARNWLPPSRIAVRRCVNARKAYSMARQRRRQI